MGIGENDREAAAVLGKKCLCLQFFTPTTVDDEGICLSIERDGKVTIINMTGDTSVATAFT